MDLDISMRTLVVLGLVTLLATVSGQNNNAQPGAVNPDPQINANGASTIKTTTVRTLPPSTRPTFKTTLGPNIKTTSRATQYWAKTTNKYFSTKNYNKLFTTRKPYIDENKFTGMVRCTRSLGHTKGTWFTF